MSSNVVSKNGRFTATISRLLWCAGCILTIGFAPKYYRRILRWQIYDPSVNDKTYRAYSMNVNSRGLGLKTSERGKQQKEWDRLIMPLSVITATSAAALAIPSPFGTPNLYWVASALYTGAFGLSLEGLLLIMYLTVFAAGSSAETVGRIASGKAFLKGKVGPVAVMTALPTAIATYSSLFLLAGLLAMTIAADDATDIKDHMAAFQVIVLVPVFLILLCVIFTVAGCEVFSWIEAKAKQEKQEKRERQEKLRPSVLGRVAEPEDIRPNEGAVELV